MKAAKMFEAEIEVIDDSQMMREMKSELGSDDEFEMANMDEIHNEIINYNSDSELEELQEAHEMIFK